MRLEKHSCIRTEFIEEVKLLRGAIKTNAFHACITGSIGCIYGVLYICLEAIFIDNSSLTYRLLRLRLKICSLLEIDIIYDHVEKLVFPTLVYS